MQKMLGMMDDMRTQLQQVEDAALHVVTSLLDTAANSIKNDVRDLKDKFEKYVTISCYMIINSSLNYVATILVILSWKNSCCVAF